MDNDIITLVHKFSNDQELGEAVRKYVANHLLIEQQTQCIYCGAEYNEPCNEITNCLNMPA